MVAELGTGSVVKSQPAILGTGGAEEQVCRKFWNTQKRCSVLEQNWHPNSVSSHRHRALGSEENTHPRWSAEGSSGAQMWDWAQS